MYFAYFQNLSIKVPTKFEKHMKLLGIWQEQFQNDRMSLEKVHLSQLKACILAQTLFQSLLITL